MGFVLPRHPLKARRTLAVDIDPAQRIVRAAELAAYVQAEQAIAAACEQADEIVAGAQEAFEEERRRGHAEGLQQARNEGAKHMTEQLARTQAYFGRVEDRLVDVVLQATRRIVEDYDDRDRVLQAVRGALSVVRNQKQIVVRVHPDHVDYVRGMTTELLAGYPGVGWLDVVGDSHLAHDLCAVESEIGVVETSMKGQLEVLHSALMQARNGVVDRKPE